jgi:hypothetical protein
MKKLKLTKSKPLDVQESSPNDKSAAASSMAAVLGPEVPSTAPAPSKAKTKAPKVKLPRLVRSWPLVKNSTRDYLADWWYYVKLLSFVALPINIASIFSVFQDPYSSSYVSLAAVVMNVTLIWAIIQRQETGEFTSIKRSYYDSSVALVRFMLTSFLLVLMLIPAAFGLTLYALGAADPTGITGIEVWLVGLVSLIFALPSVYLLVRHSLAPLASIRDGLAPMAALRRSRMLTKGYFWQTLGRLVILGLLLLVISFPITLLALGFSALKLPSQAQAVFHILATFTALPIANLYLLRLLEAIESAKEPTEAAE